MIHQLRVTRKGLLSAMLDSCVEAKPDGLWRKEGFFQFYSLGYPRLTWYTVFICLAATLSSFGAILRKAVKYSTRYSVYLATYFLMFVYFDLCLIQAIYNLFKKEDSENKVDS